jgi:hypothetical protein
LLYKFGICAPLSRNLRGGRKPRARRKWKNGRVILFNRAITQF